MEVENKKPQNPNAFPIEYQNGEFKAGMTLRDYFAAKAMQGIISVYESRSGFSVMKKECKDLANTAYSIANAMLKERKKQE